ncbi:MAG: EF-hand domain-containing protein [Candidatus Accumulibacter sp. UW20]|jgi:hypothetical protein
MALILFWLIAANGAAGTEGEESRVEGAEVPAGASPGSPMLPTVPPEVVKPVLPSDFKDAEVVFRKLDVADRGYVTRQDTKDLIGFETAFRTVDTQGSGRLTRAQFGQAWSIYTGKQ